MLILASASPARLRLLNQLGYRDPQVIPADIDETPLSKETPRIYVTRMARTKMEKIAVQHSTDVVLAADTVVVVGRRIIQKSQTPEAQHQVMELLSGRRHRVYTAVAVYDPINRRAKERLSIVHVSFKRLSAREINYYVEGGTWEGVAGYSLDDFAGSFIKQINGDPSAVIGLPLLPTRQLLESVCIL